MKNGSWPSASGQGTVEMAVIYIHALVYHHFVAGYLIVQPRRLARQANLREPRPSPSVPMKYNQCLMKYNPIGMLLCT